MTECAWPADERLPESLSRRYACLSCLQSDETQAAYLCLDREDGNRCLMKIAHSASHVRQLIQDDEMLQTLAEVDKDHTFFPEPVALLVEGEHAWQLRTWIHGQSLDQYVESAYQGCGLPESEALHITEELLVQISLLHGMDPPVIHRDIKPQNVILDNDGMPHLIDFGIARQWRPGQSFDTQINGTEGVAAPEQFGYSQTDARSDIYAIGILLRYLLTESYDEDANCSISHRTMAIIRKATCFDPHGRYQSAEDMRKALMRIDRPVRHRVRASLLVALVLIMLAGLGFAIYDRSAYTFREPLIEAAVRVQLNKPEGAITRCDLRKVTSLHIFGRQIYDDDSQFWFLGDYTFPVQSGIAAETKWQENGHIQSLDDLTQMPNCRVVSIYRQEISDLSPIVNTRIEALGIGWNRVRDFTPLLENHRLTALNLSCMELENPTFLSSLSNLRVLCLSGVGDFPLEVLADLPLTELNLADVFCSEDHWLKDIEGLRKLTVSKLHHGLMYSLRETRLTELAVTHTENVTLRELEALPSLTALSYDTGDTLEVIASRPLNFPQMHSLTLKNVSLASLELLHEMPELETLGIFACDVGDYHGLEELPSLKTIYAAPEQREILMALYPNAGWIIE